MAVHAAPPSADEESSGALPTQARAVIIGGGVMGCGVAYHLAREGWGDTVLLEKGELTSGSTWHAAGQVTYATSAYNLAQCVKYNIALYHSLEAETGQSPTFHHPGSLRMIYTDDDMDWARHIASVIRNVGLPVEIIGADEVARLHPFYNLTGIRAALHTPADGHVDPAGTAFALARGARMRGVKIFRRCRALATDQTADGWIVRTEQGDIRCQHVVNAGGAYARQMALQNGYDLPTASLTHHYFVTEPVPEFADLARELPVVRDDREVSGYIRMEQKSGLIGIYEKANPNTVWDDGAPWAAENELFDPHYDRVMPWLEKALERVPIFAERGIRRAVHGVISHPPDGNPLIGPAPALRNYWCCCGCQIGLGWGPGLTRELARWMVHGAADISMRDLDPRRFGAYADRDFQIAKGKEDYTLRHEIPFPHFSRLARRPIKQSPLHDAMAARGAVFEEVFGWERPRWFGTATVAARDIYSFRRSELHDVILDEVAGVRAYCGLMDISAFGKVMVSGAGAAALLDRLIPNRLPAVGRVGLAHLLSANGRIEVEATVARVSDERFYFGCSAYYEQRLVDYLRGAAADAAVEVCNMSAEWAAMALSGPGAREVLAGVVDAGAESVRGESFPWLSARMVAVGGGYSVLALRLSYAGELGWELHGDFAAVRAAYDAMMAQAGAAKIQHYGSFAMNTMRMEKAYPGITELTNEVTLAEAGQTRFVAADKDFVGRAATLDLAAARWRCVYLEIADNGAADGCGGEAVFAAADSGGESGACGGAQGGLGKRVGAVTSTGFSPTRGCPLAFAFVQTAYAAPGTELRVLILGEERQAKVLGEAVYDPKSLLPRQ